MNDLKARGTFLETLRLARGLTQVELAEQVEVSQATLSKVESGNLDFDGARWQSVADALDVPVTAFGSATAEVKPARVFHRKQKTTPMGAVRKIGADAALAQQRIRSLFGDTLATPQAPMRHDLEDGFVTPQEVAQAVRDNLGLGVDPIPHLTAVIEALGALVLRWPLETLQVDAVATWPEGSSPLILVGEHVPAERQRFTMAHELGHAVMHNDDVDQATDAQEREADAFAAEFLLPRKQLLNEWPQNPSTEALIPIKRKWGISLAALVRRASDCGLLDERQYRSWNIQLTTSGMHRREPEPIDPERPQALGNALRSALGQGATVDELAGRAHMYPHEFNYTFMEQQS